MKKVTLKQKLAYFALALLGVSSMVVNTAHADIFPDGAGTMVLVPPCRLVDTREIDLPLVNDRAGGDTMGFLVYGAAGDLDGQGGDSAGCPLPASIDDPTRVVGVILNVIAVGDNAATPVGTSGNIGVSPVNVSADIIGFVNFQQGFNVSNSGVVGVCTESDCGFDVFARARFTNVHMNVNVQGYIVRKIKGS